MVIENLFNNICDCFQKPFSRLYFLQAKALLITELFFLRLFYGYLLNLKGKKKWSYLLGSSFLEVFNLMSK